jgi:hypothetical protein
LAIFDSSAIANIPVQGTTPRLIGYLKQLAAKIEVE